MTVIPFLPGSLYVRRADIHGPFNGQQAGGISTPDGGPFIFIFTGTSGRSHGYSDEWITPEEFHYFGEGKLGDMKMAAGNRAIAEHKNTGRRLLLFRMLGKGKPVRYEGEFEAVDWFRKPNVPDTAGQPRTAIVFRLHPIDGNSLVRLTEDISEDVLPSDSAPEETTAKRLVEVRTKQALFRRRLLGYEKQCRLTGVLDLRFVRASHIKPWASCSAYERTDGCNGLLLSPTADVLFDRGWISFADNGQLIRSVHLPRDLDAQIGLNLKHGRKCGRFNDRQRDYLEHHRNFVFERFLMAS